MTDQHPLERQLVEAELEAEISARRADLAAGLVPADVRRALFTHELAARTNFATLDDEAAEQAAIVAGRLAADRAQLLALILDDLRRVAGRPGPTSPLQRIADRILDLDLNLEQLDGARPVVDDAERWHRGRLEVVADRAARQVAGEAVAQGIKLPADWAPKLDPVAADQLDLLARRAAQAPHVDLLRALREHVVAEEKDFLGPDELVDRLGARARELAPGPLEDVARTGVQQAQSIGRVAGADPITIPKRVYASELLDRNTCGPCSLVDGREYEDLTAARRDYPHGTYIRCEGGLRCRGTLVFVWSTEEDPTLRTPGDRPIPPASLAPPVDATPFGPTIGPAAGANLDPRAVADPTARAGAFWSYYFEFQIPLRRALLNLDAGRAALHQVDVAEALRTAGVLDRMRTNRFPDAPPATYRAADLAADLEATARRLLNRYRTTAAATTEPLYRGMNIRDAARFRPGQRWAIDVWSSTPDLGEMQHYLDGDGFPVLIVIERGSLAAPVGQTFPGRMAGSSEHLSIGNFEVSAVDVVEMEILGLRRRVTRVTGTMR